MSLGSQSTQGRPYAQNDAAELRCATKVIHLCGNSVFLHPSVKAFCLGRFWQLCQVCRAYLQGGSPLDPHLDPRLHRFWPCTASLLDGLMAQTQVTHKPLMTTFLNAGFPLNQYKYLLSEWCFCLRPLLIHSLCCLLAQSRPFPV